MSFESFLHSEELHTLQGLDTPLKIQVYLDNIAYDGADIDRTCAQVMELKRAHCLDGGLFAAAALRRLGYPPMIIDLVPAPNTDDDHVLALFRRNNRWGAVAKSNFVGLRYREPVYKSIRELVMTYFEAYHSLDFSRTLRGYTRPLNLAAFDKFEWETSEKGVKMVSKRLYGLRSVPLLTEKMIRELTLVDIITYRSNTLVTNVTEVFKPLE